MVSPEQKTHCRLNIWRQKRFAEYLTDVGKRTPSNFKMQLKRNMIMQTPIAN
jgi:hypothetical protein